MRRRYTEKERSHLIELVSAGRATVAAAPRLGVTLSTAHKWMQAGAPQAGWLNVRRPVSLAQDGISLGARAEGSEVTFWVADTAAGLRPRTCLAFSTGCGRPRNPRAAARAWGWPS